MDPTDWVYNNEVVDIGEQNVYDGEIGYRRRFVIDGGMSGYLIGVKEEIQKI